MSCQKVQKSMKSGNEGCSFSLPLIGDLEPDRWFGGVKGGFKSQTINSGLPDTFLASMQLTVDYASQTDVRTNVCLSKQELSRTLGTSNKRNPALAGRIPRFGMHPRAKVSQCTLSPTAMEFDWKVLEDTLAGAMLSKRSSIPPQIQV